MSKVVKIVQSAESTRVVVRRFNPQTNQTPVPCNAFRGRRRNRSSTKLLLAFRHHVVCWSGVPSGAACTQHHLPRESHIDESHQPEKAGNEQRTCGEAEGWKKAGEARFNGESVVQLEQYGKRGSKHVSLVLRYRTHRVSVQYRRTTVYGLSSHRSASKMCRHPHLMSQEDWHASFPVRKNEKCVMRTQDSKKERAEAERAQVETG